MSPSLASRIEDIPGVASVTVDLKESGGGINMRLEPGADETVVMEKVRALLAAYGAKPSDYPPLRLGREKPPPEPVPVDVNLTITPIKGGARVEVATPNIRSFRVVAANPSAIAQGVADAWSQVIGRIPVEIVRVVLGEQGDLEIVASNGQTETIGRANVSLGWEKALAQAVGGALGLTSPDQSRPAAVG